MEGIGRYEVIGSTRDDAAGEAFDKIGKIIKAKKGIAPLACYYGADGNRQVNLYVPPLQTRIARPEFLKENEIVFSERHPDGEENLKVLKVKKMPNGSLTADGQPRTLRVKMPKWLTV